MSPVAWGKRGVTGAVPLPYLPAAGTLHGDLGLSRDACLQPSDAQISSRGRGLGEGHRCPLKGLTLPTIARIATVRDSHREAAVFGRRLPPRASNPHVVRIAPLHDASITTCPKAHAEICTLGRSYRLMHAEELRAGPVLWPEPSNAPCVHDLGGFVKPGVTLNLFQGPSRGETLASRWMLKQVQHDDERRSGMLDHVRHERLASAKVLFVAHSGHPA